MIVVFGALGFVGTYLVHQLVTDGYDVVATDISPTRQAIDATFIQMDITKEDEFASLPQTDVSAVVNCACLQPANVSEKEYNPRQYIGINAMGTLNVLEYCRRVNSKMVYFNSRRTIKDEYGMYAISERAATDCATYYKQRYGMRNIVFRLPPVYGYGCYGAIFKEGKPIKTGFQVFVENAMQGKPLEVWGNAKVGRPIIYVKDVVSAIISAFDSKAWGIWDVWSVNKLALKQEAEDIVEVFSPQGNKSEIVYCPNKLNSIEKNKNIGFNWAMLGKWKPQYTFKDMLIDYKKEMDNGGFSFLVERRKEMFNEYFRH